jgi:glycerol-3-phosphate dehydrogenase (NAD(P)+)
MAQTLDKRFPAGDPRREQVYEAYSQAVMLNRDDPALHRAALTVALELKDPSQPLDPTELKRIISERLEGFPVEVHLVHDMPRRGSGKHRWKNKKIVSAIKGLLPGKDILLNFYLQQQFDVPLENYFAVLGPCHAEEVAAEKLSYLTFSGTDITTASSIASNFTTDYISTVINQDILGVQYAAVLKNIYALGAGIAHGLDYGDNFLSVYIANAADEMAGFLRLSGAVHIVVGEHEAEDPITHRKSPNYAASVYLGDLLVTCYSLYSRNRTFGNMIGKGYSVKAAQLEMNMIAEGYNAARCIYNINKNIKAPIPIAETIYKILWENVKASGGFKRIEEVLV